MQGFYEPPADLGRVHLIHMRARAADRMFWAIYEVQQVNMPLQQMRGQRNYERTRRPSRFFASGAWR